MKIEQVKELTPKERFFYWIKERRAIHKRRSRGQKRPWTDDEVLQTIFFTNPYREEDKTTIWFRKNVRGPFRDDDAVLMATVIFRWFNRISTGVILQGGKDATWITRDLIVSWDEKEAITRLESAPPPVFTGAYMIKAGNGPPGCKIGNVCRSITPLWNDRKELVQLCKNTNSLEQVWKKLRFYKHLGGFMAYEIVCDLRYTHLLENATDVDTWANMGPGARRGMNRVLGRDVEAPLSQAEWLVEARELLVEVRKLGLKPRMELREVEHSLCEADKYNRALFKQGKLKRKYHGSH